MDNLRMNIPTEYDDYKLPELLKTETEETMKKRAEAEKELSEAIASVKAAAKARDHMNDK